MSYRLSKTRLGCENDLNYVIVGIAPNLEEYNKVKYTDILFTCAVVWTVT